MDEPTTGSLEQRRRLAAAIAAMEELNAVLEAATPWPLAERFGHEPEASWGPPEVLAHVAEMLPYWLGELARIEAGPGPEPVPFGRVATDQVRIAIIERDRSLPPGELVRRARLATEQWERRLATLDAETAARTGMHSTLGALTVADVVERFVVGHLEDHVTQLTAAVATAATPKPAPGDEA